MSRKIIINGSELKFRNATAGLGCCISISPEMMEVLGANVLGDYIELTVEKVPGTHPKAHPTSNIFIFDDLFFLIYESGLLIALVSNSRNVLDCTNSLFSSFWGS
ncbi:MAG TPA: hypothetical protein VN368_03605 [Candidatus Methylomirabilis sp.]|nr:hypothetical protein [Candidatus Methylomirabilis sp.]